MPNSLMTFVLVFHSIIAVALVATILLQRSEGGALGIGGGGPGGLMTARGAGNFLTRATGWLAATFIATSIGLAVLANIANKPEAIDTSLAGNTEQAADTPADALPTAVPGTTDAAPGDSLPTALPAVPSDEIPDAQ